VKDDSALVVIDMINTYAHPDAEQLVPSVCKTLPNIRRLLAVVRDRNTDVIYVNDNFGRWRSHHDE
jgi:nicotinamidase-related amidase